MTVLRHDTSNEPALIEGDTGLILSHRDLADQGRAWSARLGRSRTLLFLVCRNDVFSAVAYVGAIEGGHVVALVDGHASTASIAGIVTAYRPAWIAGAIGLGAELAANSVPVTSIEVLDGGELVETGYNSANDLHPDLAVLLATSGTTGSRKFVRLSARNIHSNARSIAEFLGLTPDERAITCLPFHYSFGLSVVNSHLLAGASVVLTTASVLEERFWRAFQDYGCSSLAGVPFTFQVLERVGFRTMDLPSLRTLQQAGGALDRGLAELYTGYMAGRGGQMFVMYGQTEATARIAYVPPDRMPAKLGSAGIAIPGGHLRIDADPDVGPSEPATGEIVYEGPNVMMGYGSGADDLGRPDELHGVLRTGDIGYLDEDGFLFIVGRSKRIAKVFGLRLNLDEVETRLRQSGPAAVMAGQDAIWGFCEFGTDETLAAVASELARDFRIHHSTVRLKRVEMLPTTSAGKIDYQQVERWIVD
jgi:acyl-CoA synthetase (AMP-forming)/AMP-acid ligase II